jgi:2-C-methyl-D-erythritol 4-phosphate cytidylyltransferase
MRYWLVMPAAGVGRRFGENTPKQYAELHGRTVMEWSLAPFLYDSRCAGVIVVVGLNDPHWPSVAARLPDVSVATTASEASIAAALEEVNRASAVADLHRAVGSKHGMTPGKATKGNTPTGGADTPASWASDAVSLPSVTTAIGGKERSQSVRNGLAALAGRASPDDWVLVHDAARPCVPRQDVDRLLERVSQHAVGGLLAAPAADTLKRAGSDKEIVETVDRSGLWRALTPQMFRYGRLCEALDRALASGRLPTDEAQALEWVGERPVVVEGSTANIKITSADDLVIAVALMSGAK